MYNVLIVDDEPMIREGLTTLIPWTSYGFNVIDSASNGKEALEKYHNHHFDLIIVDIRMPEMNGITFIETIRQTDKDVHFIILSGYADFEYAKKAISARVTGYLLKPVDEDELVEYLEKLKKKLDQQQSLNQLKISNHTLLKNKFILSLLHEESSVYEYEELDQWQLTSKEYQIILLKFLSSNNIDIEEIKQALAQSFEPDRAALFINDSTIGMIVKDIPKTQESYQYLFETIKKIVHVYDPIISMSEVVSNIEELPTAYRYAKGLLENHFYYEEKCFLSKDSKPFIARQQVRMESKEVYESLLDSYAEKIYFAIDIASHKGIEERLIEMAQLLVNEGCTEDEIKRYYFRMISTVLNKCSAEKPEIQFVLSEVSEGMMDIYKQSNLPQLIKYIEKLFTKIMSSLEYGDQHDQMKRLEDFILRNYHKHLKLEMLAEIFNYNSAYLGKIFKNYTGEYFNTYLDKVRIENAKILLNKGLKVYQVAEQVGFTNVDYFHNKFKKYVGASPSTYRKKVK
ncbi:MAG TPA: response regulator transcription factor [Metabacillus sp.]|nr:response regulator transcription factor [Metabacillus sp.]